MTDAPTPDRFDMAALNRKRQEVFDIMAPGPGTSWENRGSEGVVTAFFRTCIQSMFSPGKLLDRIRRPETTGDATQFVIGCGVLWAVSAAIHNFLWYRHWANDPQHWEVDGHAFFIASALQVAITPVVVWAASRFVTLVYSKLISHDMKSRSTPQLMYNVVAYTMGPSLVSVVPVIGPPVAILWVAFNWVVAGVKRLYVRLPAVIIATAVTLGATVAVGAIGYWLGDFLYHQAVTPAVTPHLTLEQRQKAALAR